MYEVYVPVIYDRGAQDVPNLDYSFKFMYQQPMTDVGTVWVHVGIEIALQCLDALQSYTVSIVSLERHHCSNFPPYGTPADLNK